ncbi:MAG: DNA polymerase III subunit alpha [Bacteroidales bacterium]|nr:DNA polymerase III subunit alpha [Bacteroidales bacterium]
MQPFVHLHVHSHYSILDGQASIPSLVDKAIGDGMKAISLTDHGNMFGAKEFFNYISKKNGKYNQEISELKKEISKHKESAAIADDDDRIIELNQKIDTLSQKLFKPILGCEAYVARNNRHIKSGKENLSGHHLVILAKNKVGYHNLIKLVSQGWTEGFYGRPRIDKELLEQYKEGLIISTACLGGEIPRLIAQNKLDEAENSILWFKKHFGEDYYLEMQRHKTDNPTGDQETYKKQQFVNKELIELSKRTGVKLIATNDVHFANEEDADAHEHLICLSTGKDLNDPNRLRYTKQEWLKTQSQMNEIFADMPEVLENTIEIVDKVEFYSINSDAVMPEFPLPEGFDNDGVYLKHLTYKGANTRYEEITDEIRERIDFELETILNMGFPGYFLIVQDFIAAARAMKVAVGPGRGSAAGSVVAYCLGITDIDPIKYDLLFERFLNPDRISMPDIDIDFDDDGRGEVLRWVTEKYGKEKVAHIVTFGTMATKSAIKDVARVQKLSLSESERLTKLIPDRIPDKKINLRNSIAYVPELQVAASSPDPLLSNTLKYAQMLEGTVRNTGVHACGIIIGKDDLTNYVPLSTATDKETGESMIVTQYEGSLIEDVGMLKMDFLGLKTLSIIKDALENIKITNNIDIDISKISLEDEKTYELYSSGKTTGTFQFESAGMQKYLRELQPTKFEDLIAMNALYRPGPMDYIPSFVARKHGREPIEYDIPIMERYLKDTYGITVYQEQVMLLSRLLANFTRGQSDELRKAMGKKLIDKMNALKAKFIEGVKKNGHDPKVCEKIWADWEKFASYAFNKSHATCYSWIAYQTAYLKANYPSEYMAAVLSRNISNITDITKFMDECKAMGLEVLGPDVNESFHKFAVNKKGDIRFGLGAIKGVGEGAVEAIIEERINGPFVSIFDFVERINLTACNKKSMESMALAGAFDNFTEIKREQFFEVSGKDDTFLESLLRYGNKAQIDKAAQTNSLFGGSNTIDIAKPEIPIAEAWSDLERLNKERDLVGIYLSAHPLDEYSIILNHVCNTKMTELSNRAELVNREITMGGIITNIRIANTKTGKPFGVMKIEDYSGAGEIALFGNDFIEYRNYFTPNLFLYIKGRYVPRKYNENELDFKINSIQLLNDVKEKLIEKFTITVPLEEVTPEFITDITALVKDVKGNTQFNITVIDEINHYDVPLYATNVKTEVTKSLLSYIETFEKIGFKIN